jgi:ribosome biogenesis protein ENP2
MLTQVGTYKPQIHTHYLPHLSLSFARHTDALNLTFLLLSSDYTKSLHLQSDRSLEFHTAGNCHYKTRIPRYGRDLVYDKRSTEALIPCVGVNADGNGEVYRLNLEVGRYLKAYEIDVGGDDMTSSGGGALQGGINTGAVNTAAIAEESHNLLAFGTTKGTVELWDGRSRARVGLLSSPAQNMSFADQDSPSRVEITALKFHRSGLTLATGSSEGLIHLYDLRSPVPLLKKDQGYGFPIKTLTFLTPSSESRSTQGSSEPKILSADKRIIKIWDQQSGAPWTAVEPTVDMNNVEWCKDSGMLLTSNEGKQQHSFFIPQLGPAPKWCSFLDNLVEEMAEEHLGDPHAYNAGNAGSAAGGIGAIYDNYKFLTTQQLQQLNLSHLIGTTNLLRPYMHGYFVAQRLYEEARLIADPYIWEEQRAKRVKEKIEKERESRIRSSGNRGRIEKVKVNQRLAERALKEQERHERRKARKLLDEGDKEEEVELVNEDIEDEAGASLLKDSRFSKVFQDEEFAVDERTLEFRQLNPSTKPTSSGPVDSITAKARGRTAVDDEESDKAKGASSSSDDSESDSDEEDAGRRGLKRAAAANRPEKRAPDMRISSSSYKKSGHESQRGSAPVKKARPADRSFGSRAAATSSDPRSDKRFGKDRNKNGGDVVGEREITFAPERKSFAKSDRGAKPVFDKTERKSEGRRDKGRRSASGNVFRGL